MNSTTLADSHNSIYTSHRRKLGSRAVSTGLIQCARREPKRPLSLAASQPTKPLSAETQNDAPKDAVCIFPGGRFA
jgi:hypothetical protein